MQLTEIRDTASKFAETIAKVLDVDVMIIDKNFARVADTFRYVNNPPPVRAESLTGQVLATGKVLVARDKMAFETCRDCSFQDECCISQIISVPIFYADAVVGAIDLLVPFGKESPVFDRLELSVDFLERMADLLSSKLRNIDDYNRLDVTRKEREILLDFVEDAFVYVNELGEIIHYNKEFSRQFDLDSGAVGRRIDRVIDHPAIWAAVQGPRPASYQDFRFEDRKVSFNGFMTSRSIQRNGVKYGVMLSFKRRDKAFSALNEISRVRISVPFDSLCHGSVAMRAVVEAAKRYAVGDSIVLVSGPPGVGKSMLAKAIHDFSDREARPFIVVECRGFSPEYLAEEIFGNDDEEESRLVPSGKLRLAQDGTVFFKHIEDLPLALQKRLTRVIKSRKLGEEDSVPARMLFSSSADIPSLVARRYVDEELAVRISQLELALPPLSARPEDAALLVDYFIQKNAALSGRSMRLEREALDLLKGHAWPGNVRQLERVVECLYEYPSDAPLSVADIEGRLGSLLGDERSSLQSFESMEKRLIQRALSLNPNKDEAARNLGIGRATLYRKLKQYGL